MKNYKIYFKEYNSFKYNIKNDLSESEFIYGPHGKNTPFPWGDLWAGVKKSVAYLAANNVAVMWIIVALLAARFVLNFI